MDWESKEGRCTLACWAGAMVIGLLAFFVLDTFLFKLLAQIGGLLVLVGAGIVLTQTVCVSHKAPPPDPADLSPDAVAAPQAAPAPGAGGSAALAQPGSGGAARVHVPADAGTAEWDEAQESGSTAATSAVAYVEPEVPESPQGGTADDLKRLEGIGPKVEETLNGLGIWRYDQIAAWTGEDVARIEAEAPALRGRAARDDWVGQAKALSTGNDVT
ncbi:hypothetical protein [Pseudooceanicola sp.]|uniref:hypothetical protein n=1 Tax=Pseudooceanicola sp. TaxID=1914328 RepID=UPI0035173A3A